MNKSQPLGGVVFDWKKINTHNGLINGNLCIPKKLSLFVGLRCKPMKDVFLHHGAYITKGLTLCIVDRKRELATPIYIEAIPERLTDVEINDNLIKMALQWKYAPQEEL